MSSLTLTQSGITNFNRSRSELEEFAIFSVLVAGKTAKTMINVLTKLLAEKYHHQYPFNYLRTTFKSPSTLAEKLKSCGAGCHTYKAKTIDILARSDIDLKTCQPKDLEEIWGIAEKTSRFFKLHSDKNFVGAALDRHILRWLTDLGYEDIPKNTPRGRKYVELEELFLYLAADRGLTPAELDWKIWEAYSTKSKRKRLVHV